MISNTAGVAELADAPDLGSGKPSLWGFKSPLSHHSSPNKESCGMYDIVSEDGNRRKVRFSQSAERIEELFTRVRKEISRGLDIPGFRPGKVPRSIIDRQYGNMIRAEVADTVRRELTSKIIDEEDWILDDTDPEADMELPVEGSDYSFEMTFSLFETPEPEGIRGVTITLPIIDLEKIAEETVQSFRERMVTFEEVDRPASKGDVVVMNTAPEGSTEEPREMNVRIGEGQLGPGFDALCEGASPGYVFLARMRNEDGVAPGPPHSFKVEKVLEPVLPELNDEFAEKAAGVSNMEELRDKVMENVTERRDQEIEYLKDRQAIDGLLESNPFDPPAYMVSNLTADYLQRLGEEEPGDKAREAAAEMAGRKVREFLILRAVALKEGIVITEEDIEAERNPEESASSVLDRLRNRRAMELVLSEATIEESEPPEPSSKEEGSHEESTGAGWRWESVPEGEAAPPDMHTTEEEDNGETGEEKE